MRKTTEIKKIIANSLNIAGANIRVRQEGGWIHIFLNKPLESYLVDTIGEDWRGFIEETIDEAGVDVNTYYIDDYGDNINDERNCIAFYFRSF